MSTSRPHWNSLFRVRVHAWIAVVSSTLAWPLWTYFCRDYIQGQGAEYNALVNEPLEFETHSFNELVDKLAAKVKDELGELTGVNNATQAANKIAAALADQGTVKPKIKDLVNNDFGIGEQNVSVSNKGNEVEVTIGGGAGNTGTATVNVSGKTLTIKVQGKGVDKATKIAKRLAKATELAALRVDKLRAFKVTSDETETEVAKFLATKLRQAGSAQFNDLVEALKKQEGISSPDKLDRDKLKQALKQATEKIKALVQKEFELTTVTEGGITVQKGEGNNVEVEIKGSGTQTHDGSSVVNDKVTIVVKLDQQLTGDPSKEKAICIAQRLAKAARDAASKVANANLVEALVHTEFGYSDKDVKVEVQQGASKNTVTVTITKTGTEKGQVQGEAKVTVKKTVGGGSEQKEIKIKVQGNKLKSKSQGNRIAWKLGAAIHANADKFLSVTINSPSVDKKLGVENSLSALCMFPLGAFTEDFMYPGLLPYAFLDPQNANLINYTMPLFYMTGAVFVLLVNDVFHPTGFIKHIDPSLDSWFKDWSEGEVDPSTGWDYSYMWLP